MKQTNKQVGFTQCNCCVTTTGWFRVTWLWGFWCHHLFFTCRETLFLKWTKTLKWYGLNYMRMVLLLDLTAHFHYAWMYAHLHTYTYMCAWNCMHILHKHAHIITYIHDFMSISMCIHDPHNIASLLTYAPNWFRCLPCYETLCSVTDKIFSRRHSFFPRDCFKWDLSNLAWW